MTEGVGVENAVATVEGRTGDDGPAAVMTLEHVTVTFGDRPAVRDISFDVARNRVTSLIGPSGSGKTTLLRALNRMHDRTRRAKVSGTVTLEGVDVYRGDLPATLLRSRIGMVFQRPNPFPSMSIFENVASGLAFNSVRDRTQVTELVEKSLREAVLWDAVKDRLKSPASRLSGGEQQRLCIARALAVEPEVLLMDEPTSSLDPIATQQIEDLVTSLKELVTIIIVTHNMAQAARVSDDCAFLLMAEDQSGELIEFNTTSAMFNTPRDPRTLDYVQGKFG